MEIEHRAFPKAVIYGSNEGRHAVRYNNLPYCVSHYVQSFERRASRAYLLNKRIVLFSPYQDSHTMHECSHTPPSFEYLSGIALGNATQDAIAIRAINGKVFFDLSTSRLCKAGDEYPPANHAEPTCSRRPHVRNEQDYKMTDLTMMLCRLHERSGTHRKKEVR
jgi:hypothetical protein